MGIKVSTSELKMVARSKGWTGKGASKSELIQWLGSRGISLADAVKSVGTLRAAIASGGAISSSGGPTLSKGDVLTLIDQRIATLPKPEAPVVDPKQLLTVVKAAVAEAQPARIVLAPPAKPVVIKERTHRVFEKVLKLVNTGSVNILLVGPAGCGKTTLAHQLAAAIRRRYGTMHCTAGASESQLIGWLLPIGKGGAFEYVPAEFVRLFEEGNSLFLLDEIDGADANMLMVLNAALSNGTLHVPIRYKKPHVERGKNATIIAAANTFGTGADTIYVGRNQLDAATLDRFYVIEMDYDRDLEAEMAPKEICEWVWGVRDKARAARLRRVVSTRTIQRLAAATMAGISFDEAKRDALRSWTPDELVKIGEAV